MWPYLNVVYTISRIFDHLPRVSILARFMVLKSRYMYLPYSVCIWVIPLPVMAPMIKLLLIPKAVIHDLRS